MADLNQLQAAQTVKIAGSDSSGNETTFVSANLSGQLQTESALVDVVNGNPAAVLNTSPTTTTYGLVVRPILLELPTHIALSANVTVGNNKSMLAIQNTSTSIVTLREIWIINDRTTAVTGVAGIFQVRRITSFTGGTPIIPATFDTADTLPAGITLATNATVSGETSILRQGVWSTDEWGPGTLDTEGLDHAIQNTEPFFRQPVGGKGLVVRQNQGVHVKFATNSTAGDFNIRFIFTVG